MWWSEHWRAAAGRARIFLLLGLVGLGACGLEPVYGNRNGMTMRHELAGIQIAAIEDRIGREVRNNLIDRLTPFGAPDQPRYRLDVTLEQMTIPLAIQLDDRITRFNLTLMASFSLLDLDSGTAVYIDSVRAVGSYNVVESEYATVVSQQDAGDRAAREVSNEITALLVVYFSRQDNDG